MDDLLDVAFPYCSRCGETISEGDIVNHYMSFHNEELRRAVLTDNMITDLEDVKRRLIRLEQSEPKYHQHPELGALSQRIDRLTGGWR